MTILGRHIDRKPTRRGIALIIVLWAVVLLSIILTNFSFLVRTHVNLARNFALEAELATIAEAGVERAIASLKADTTAPDTLFEIWADDEDTFSEAVTGSGNFTVYTNTDDESQLTRFGLDDEASKLNIATADRETLMRLEGMEPELVSALIDWRDEDFAPEPDGAETETYAELADPYPCKNAAFSSLEELLLVAGYNAEILYGEDWNQNGVLDPNENDGDETIPPDDGDGLLNRGILPYITIYSMDVEKSQDGADRVDINSASESQLQSQIPGLTQDEAKAIVAHRDDNEFEQLGQLLNVREASEEDNNQQNNQAQPPQNNNQEVQQGRRGRRQGNRRGNNNQDQQGNQSQPQQNQQANGQGQGNDQEGELIIDANRLKQIIDFCKINGDAETAGRVNINTAPAIVLRTLPGITEELADAIFRARVEQRKVFNNIAELMDIPGITNDIFIPLSNQITVRSDQFRVRSVARMENVEMQREIIAVLDRSDTTVQTLYWTKR